MTELSMQNGVVVDNCQHDWQRKMRENDTLPYWECERCDKVVESDPEGP